MQQGKVAEVSHTLGAAMRERKMTAYRGDGLGEEHVFKPVAFETLGSDPSQDDYFYPDEEPGGDQPVHSPQGGPCYPARECNHLHGGAAGGGGGGGGHVRVSSFPDTVTRKLLYCQL